jgi:hypothetical protein
MLSVQAWIIMSIYIISAIMSLVMMIKMHIPIYITLLFVFIWLITIPLLTYDTHCLTDGPCGVWSWIRTVLYCITPVVVILTSLFSGSKSSEESQEGVTITVA